jgi:hypothetical protein
MLAHRGIGRLTQDIGAQREAHATSDSNDCSFHTITADGSMPVRGRLSLFALGLFFSFGLGIDGTRDGKTFEFPIAPVCTTDCNERRSLKKNALPVSATDPAAPAFGALLGYHSFLSTPNIFRYSRPSSKRNLSIAALIRSAAA